MKLADLFESKKLRWAVGPNFSQAEYKPAQTDKDRTVVWARISDIMAHTRRDYALDLQDPKAEFREVFRFKDKSVRRQRHTMNMRDIKDFIQMATMAGWKYDGNIDLMSAGFEYAYVLMFTHP